MYRLRSTCRLERVLDHVCRDLRAHVLAGAEREAIVHAAPHADIFLLLAIAARLSKCRVFLGSRTAVALNGMVFTEPNTDSKTAVAIVALMVACDGYSGCIGVGLNEVQPASRSVASLPSWSPLRIAVTGRLKSQRRVGTGALSCIICSII